MLEAHVHKMMKNIFQKSVQQQIETKSEAAYAAQFGFLAKNVVT